MKRSLRLITAGLLVAGLAQAYYHFLRFTPQGDRLPQRFDLAALPARTVQYFVSDRGPTAFAPGDSLPSVLSQIRLAAKQWSDVETSELRLQYGGITTISTVPQATPGIDILFDEIPPGLIAYGGPTVTLEPTPGATFVPIQRAQMVLPRDLSRLPSFSEAFFGTLVHEFGHTVGLQHSLASSAMSTAITRAVSKGRPLAADDIAGVSLLYPTRAFAQNFGAISGRVTVAGSGVALASVVAMSANGVAVGVLTNPDGTYRIEGLPGGNYVVYVHPLPPAQLGEATPANIVLPQDANRQNIAPPPAFDLQFFPGVREVNQATPLAVSPGAVAESVNFAVSARTGGLSLYNVQAFSFPGQVAVRPATVNVAGQRNFFVATGNGLVGTNNQPAAGLQASVFGGSSQVVGFAPYSAGYLQFNLAYSGQPQLGPQHMVFSNGTETYVQPSVFWLSNRQPPQITALTPAADGRSFQVTGVNLGSDTQFLFDGAPAAARADGNGNLLLTPPPALAGQRAAVVAINGDGQSSLYLQGDQPVTQTLDGPAAPAFTLSPSSLPAGIESAVELTSPNGAFANGLLSIGFGTADIQVRGLWVVSPTRAIVQVAVSPSVSPGPVTVTIANGLQNSSLPQAFSVTPALPRQPQLVLPFAGPAGVGVPSGGALMVSLANVTGTPAFAFRDQPVAYQVLGPNLFFLSFPATVAPGPGILRTNVGGESLPPIAMQIEPGGFAIVATTIGTATPGATAARAGDTLQLQVNGLADLTQPFARPRVVVTIGGIDHLPQSLSGNTVTITLLPSVAAGPQPLAVTADGRTTPSTSITVVR